MDHHRWMSSNTWICSNSVKGCIGIKYQIQDYDYVLGNGIQGMVQKGLSYM